MAKSTRPPGTRVPVQKRSQETFEIILLGTARLLEKTGYEGLNTNKIADAAGVNVATLYQYFQNKESIVSELIDREIGRSRSVFMATLKLLDPLPLALGLPLLVKAMVEVYSANPKLQPAIHEAIPLVGKVSALREAEESCRRALEPYFESRRSELRVSDPEFGAFVTVKVLSRVSEEVAISYADLFAGDRIALELTDLLTGYLTRAGAGPSR